VVFIDLISSTRSMHLRQRLVDSRIISSWMRCSRAVTKLTLRGKAISSLYPYCFILSRAILSPSSNPFFPFNASAPARYFLPTNIEKASAPMKLLIFPISCTIRPSLKLIMCSTKLQTSTFFWIPSNTTYSTFNDERLFASSLV
jgi:hypothetical protein